MIGLEFELNVNCFYFLPVFFNRCFKLDGGSSMLFDASVLLYISIVTILSSLST